MDPVFYLGLGVLVFSVFLVAFVTLTSIAVAAYTLFRWAKRGMEAEQEDLRAVRSILGAK